MGWLNRVRSRLGGARAAAATAPPGPLASEDVPMPPLELRRLVGPTEPEAFDNPAGGPVFGFAPEDYESVFDFGCGCGRLARQLLLQKSRPRRYVGIDVHKGMIEWCQRHLTPVDPRYRFFHHDVYAHSYAPGNRLQLSEPFPLADGEASLVLASSVFTHLYLSQAEYYLSEVARILSPGGTAFTTWFFFDRDSYPFLVEGPYCLYVGERDPTQAVIFDRRWFLDTVRRLGLGVKNTIHPPVSGHQWAVSLGRRDATTVDKFPLGEEQAEWLCGATAKPMARPEVAPEVAESLKVHAVDPQSTSSRPTAPPLFGVLAELEATRRALEEARRFR
jgi:SAM-dependent methyltransferase